jgi:hypothetical protein
MLDSMLKIARILQGTQETFAIVTENGKVITTDELINQLWIVGHSGGDFSCSYLEFSSPKAIIPPPEFAPMVNV